MVPAIARRAIAVFKPLFRFFLFLDNGAAQLVQPLLHTQQQIPAQYHREAEVADSAEDLFGIHSRYASTVTVTTLMRASTNSFSPRPPLVSTPASIILAAAACASAKVTSSRGQRVQSNPNLNSAESSLLTFFQESLKKLKKIEENIVFFKKQPF